MTSPTRIAPTRPQNEPLAASRRLRVCCLMALLEARPADPFEFGPKAWAALEQAALEMNRASADIKRVAQQGQSFGAALRDATANMRAMRATHKG